MLLSPVFPLNWIPAGHRSLRRAGSRQPAAVAGLERLERRELLAVTNFGDSAGAGAVHTSAEGVDSLFVTGSYRQSVDVDPGAGEYWLAPVTSDPAGGGSGSFIARYTQDGQLVWAKPTGVFGIVRNLVVQGDALFVGTGVSITKYDLDGNEIWSTATWRLNKIAVDVDGSVYSIGSTNIDGTPTDINPGQEGVPGVIPGGPHTEVYLAKWDANGSLLWYRRLTGTNNKWTNDVEVKDGVVYFAGRFFGTLDADDASTTNTVLTDQKVDPASTRVDGFVAQFTTSGAFVSVSQFVDAETNSLAIGNGEVYVGGTHDYATDLDPGAAQYVIPTPLNEAGFIVRLARNPVDGSLSFVSAKSFGTTTSASVGSLALKDGTLYAGGQFYGQSTRTSFGTVNGQAQTLLPLGTWDAFLLSVPTTDVTNSGLNWVRQLGTSTYGQEGWGNVAVGATGVYGGGSTMAGAGTFGGFAIHNGGEEDGFVTKLSTSGQPQWLFGIGSVVRTIDNGTPGYTDAGGWTNSNFGFNGTSRNHRKGTGSAVATWTFTGLPNGTYEVQVRWPAASKNATNAPYSVNGSSPILVNQTQTPAPAGGWFVLGTFTITNGTLTVRLTDKANSTVVADAARVIFLEPPAPSQAAASQSLAIAGAEPQSRSEAQDAPTSNDVASLVDATPSRRHSRDHGPATGAAASETSRQKNRRKPSGDDLFSDPSLLQGLLS